MAEATAPVVKDLVWVFATVLLVALAAILVALYLNRRIAASARHLRERALAIGRGELKGWVELDQMGELRDLAEAFNSMSKELLLRERGHSSLLEDLKAANQQLVVASVRNQELVVAAEEARQRLEELAATLQKERDVLQAIMENTRAQLAYLDPQFNFVRVNSAYALGSGHLKEMMVGRNHFELFPDPDNEAIFARVRDEGEEVQLFAKPFEYVDQPERGVTYWDWTLRPVKDANGQLQGLVFSLLDVTEGVRIQEALRESEERYRSLFETSAEAIMVADENGRLQDANPQSTLLTGYTREELLGMNMLNLMPPERRQEVSMGFEHYRRLGRMRGEYRLLRKDGREVDVEFDTVSIAAGRHQSVMRDITERKRVEQFREEYISLVSHDLRNPLTAMKGHADLLSRLLARQGLDRELSSAQAIEKSARRMNSMIQDLVESVGLESGRLEMREEPADLNRLIGEVIEGMVSVEDQQRIRVEAPDSVPPVLVDIDRIERAIANLISNALKYSPPEAPVTIRLEQREDELLIAVMDRGIGISAQELPQLFQRFYRAKSGAKAEGLGLGLYISRLIVESHGGRIWAESEEGKGSSFIFSLPSSGARFPLPEWTGRGLPGTS